MNDSEIKPKTMKLYNPPNPHKSILERKKYLYVISIKERIKRKFLKSKAEC